jgi:peptidoglycan hydrolase-like amidase
MNKRKRAKKRITGREKVPLSIPESANDTWSMDFMHDVLINGRKFRGNMEFIKKDNSGLAVINYIDLEDYVKGILYHEVSHYWPVEALKAQAVVCRTYALNQMRTFSPHSLAVISTLYIVAPNCPDHWLPES